MAELDLFHYEYSDSFIFRLHPLSKFLVMLLLCFLVFKANMYCILYVSIIIAISIISLKINIILLIKNTKLLLFYFVLIVIANNNELLNSKELVFTIKHNVLAVSYIGKLYIVLLLSESFFLSTSLWDLANEITVFFRKISRKAYIDPGFFISLSIGYIPKILSFYRKTSEAAICRGYRLSLFRFKPAVIVLASFIYQSFLNVLTNVDALEVRSYSSKRSVLTKKYSLFDIAIPLLNLGLCIYFIVFE